MPEKLTVVIGTYNRLDQLKECLDSLIGKFSIPVQVWVADAGSTDGTVDYLESRLHEMRVNFDGERIGQAKSLNRVMRACESDYICWISDDNVALPEVFEKAVKALDEDHGLGMIGLKVKDVIGPHSWAPYIGGISELGILNVNQGMVRRSVLEEVGYFSEKYFDYGIDNDLVAKVLASGHGVAYTRDIAIHHYREWAANPDAGDVEKRMERQRQSRKIYRHQHKHFQNMQRTGWLRKFVQWVVDFDLRAVWVHLAANYFVLTGWKAKRSLFDPESLAFNPKGHAAWICFVRNVLYWLMSPLLRVIGDRAEFVHEQDGRLRWIRNREYPTDRKQVSRSPESGSAAVRMSLVQARRYLQNISHARYVSLWDWKRSWGKDYYLIQKIDHLPEGVTSDK